MENSRFKRIVGGVALASMILGLLILAGVGAGVYYFLTHPLGG